MPGVIHDFLSAIFTSSGKDSCTGDPDAVICVSF